MIYIYFIPFVYILNLFFFFFFSLLCIGVASIIDVFNLHSAVFLF